MTRPKTGPHAPIPGATSTSSRRPGSPSPTPRPPPAAMGAHVDSARARARAATPSTAREVVHEAGHPSARPADPPQIIQCLPAKAHPPHPPSLSALEPSIARSGARTSCATE